MGTAIAGLDASSVTRMAEGRPWHAVQVYAGQELRFLDHMIRDGLEGYSPTYQCPVRWSDRTKMVSRALFTGYVFAQFNRCQRADLVRIPQLVRILDLDLSAAEMQRIQTLTDIPSVEPFPYASLIGQEVEVGPNHPLAGTRGIVLRERGRSALVVEIPMLQRAVKVTIDGLDLLPIIPTAARRCSAPRNYGLSGSAAGA